MLLIAYDPMFLNYKFPFQFIFLRGFAALFCLLHASVYVFSMSLLQAAVF